LFLFTIYKIDFSVAGGGLTAGVTSSLIASHAKEQNITLKVWDKARGLGGRMSTSRSAKNPGTDSRITLILLYCFVKKSFCL